MTSWTPVSPTSSAWTDETNGAPGSIWDAGATTWDVTGNVAKSIWDQTAVSTVWTPIT